ncbi:hypothetical protein B5S30_g2585 [[Candida] boidinii]|nr:hypothetical protein B5S30_g2585 [[Candida] boidinii]
MARSDKLARLRAARAGKKLEDEDSDQNVDIYEEVNELEYRKHKRDQLLKDDFIVDENGEGYAETGADEWDNSHKYYSDEEKGEEDNDDDESGSHGIKKTKKIKKTAEIQNFFKTTSNSDKQKPKPKKMDTNLNDILDDFVNVATSKTKSTPFFSNSSRKRDVFSTLKSDRSFNKSNDSIKPLNFSKMLEDEDDDFRSKKAKFNSSDVIDGMADYSMDLEAAPSSPIKRGTELDQSMNYQTTKDSIETGPDTQNILNDLDMDTLPKIEDDVTVVKKEKEESDDDDDEEDDDIIVAHRTRASGSTINRNVNLSSKKDLPEPKPKQKPIDSSPLKYNTSVTIKSSPSRSSVATEKWEEDQIVTKSEDGNSSFKMFWLDYAEVENTLLLFGKVRSRTGELLSTMVQIKGLERELYFLPREKRKTLDDDEDEEMKSEEDKDEESSSVKDEKVTAMDVYDEIIPLLMEKYGLKQIKAKPETKKYAFELKDIPKEAEYLKVLLPYETPKSKHIPIPSTLEGSTFSHVFGGKTNIFESFVLQRNVMGPCWLEIKNGDFNAVRNSSHCNIEVAVDSPRFVKPLDINEPAPELTLMSISVQPVMNVKESKQEVGSVSFALYKDVPQDIPVDENLKPDEIITLVRPVGGSLSLPPGLSQLAQKKGHPIRSFSNEKTLLNCLTALIKKSDPDVILGHRLENVSMDILLHRMYDLKVNTWSVFGRRHRKQWPDRFGRSAGRNNVFFLREVVCGRLTCDIANELGQSLTPKCQSWDLYEMLDVVCKKKHAPMEINLNNPKFADDANSLLAAFNENTIAVQIIAEVAFRVQILSLSKQLTNLAGNAWSSTLAGTRAGRNEFILLHEFTRDGFIVPDKESRADRQRASAFHSSGNGEDGDDEVNNDDESKATTSKKSKYQGGLVFEPEKGLQSNYVLVMDFNSLYPSIIQEFNICFTTVNRANLIGDDLPSVPSPDVSAGVFPKLLNALVSRRREVKKLLKDPRSTAIEKAQYDIKQQALKVTANSMYGCLGYVNSRFYAKPLAMLVTNRGREILMDTRQLAESIGLRVVYGDTDSVMIDTGTKSYPEAIKVGDDFKVKVNERYKLLEIDIDNVFKKLLLHSKKKYAALDTSFKDGKEICNLEVKGLDMKRREYCPLSKEVSTYILEKILGDSEPEEALNEIYQYLEKISSDLKENKIPMVKLKINTKLSKAPHLYPGGKSMPAVQVALRLLNQGKIIKAGSVMTFIITDAGMENGVPVAERARALSEVLSKNSEYKPDAMYYLEKQIFAPIERLLEKIEGSDVVRLANSLGLDSRRYEARARFNSSNTSNELQPLESTISDSERFRESKFLKLNCSCGSSFKFGGLMASGEYQVVFSGIKCLQCEKTMSTLSLTAQLERVIRQHISSYYAGWLHCDECGITTRQISVYGRRCIGMSGKAHGCKGIMHYKYSDKQLYNQLLYFDSIFDVDKAIKRLLKPLVQFEENSENLPKQLSEGELQALAEQNRILFGICKNVVNKYLTDCGRRYVDMGSIFGMISKN